MEALLQQVCRDGHGIGLSTNEKGHDGAATVHGQASAQALRQLCQVLAPPGLLRWDRTVSRRERQI